MNKFVGFGRRCAQALVGLVVAGLISACGGGGTNAGTPVLGPGSGASSPNGSTATATMTVTVKPTAVTAAAPGTVTAVLTSATGSPLAGQLVIFTTQLGLGVFSAGSALTDSTGTATVTLAPASATSNGADVAIATASIGSGTSATTVTGQGGFTASATAVPAASFTLSLSSQTITAASPATLTATLTSASGTPISGQVVKFTTTSGLGTFSASSALTNSSGVATTTMFPTNSTSAGADTVTATVTASGTTLSSTAGFQATATAVTITSFTSDVASGSSLAAYGQANLTLVMSGTVSTTPVNVAITSQCAALATPKATLTPTTLSTITGSAAFTYVDKGCGATQSSDLVTVTAGSVTKTLTIPLTSPAVATMAFVSATPSTLFLSTSGSSPQSSVVTFQLNDQNGNGVPGKSVTLTPSTTIGGLTMDSQSGAVTKLTNSLGQVSVQINSGTVPTPVRVQATYTTPSGATISSSSSNLSIAVGLPTQTRFSLSQQFFNIEAYDVDLTPNTYNIFAADRMGNPVPSSTAFNLVNTMGQVLTQPVTGPSTAISTTSVVSASGGVRPYHWDGRVTTLAYAIGEMSFTDLNGNNSYDAGEDFQDLGDPYLDPKFRGYFDSSLQVFPFGNTAACVKPASINYYLYDELAGASPTSGTAYTAPAIPAEPNTCKGSWGKAYVRSAVQTIWSTSAARPTWGTATPAGFAFAPSLAGCPASRTSLITTTQVPASGSSPSTFAAYQPTAAGAPYTSTEVDVDGTSLFMQTGGNMAFYASDANAYAYNPMASGTTVTVTSSPSGAITAAVIGGGTVGNSLTPTPVTTAWSFNIGFSSGTLTFTFTSPTTHTTTTASVNVNAANPPNGYVQCP